MLMSCFISLVFFYFFISLVKGEMIFDLNTDSLLMRTLLVLCPRLSVCIHGVSLTVFA